MNHKFIFLITGILAGLIVAFGFLARPVNAARYNYPDCFPGRFCLYEHWDFVGYKYESSFVPIECVSLVGNKIDNKASSFSNGTQYVVNIYKSTHCTGFPGKVQPYENRSKLYNDFWVGWGDLISSFKLVNPDPGRKPFK